MNINYEELSLDDIISIVSEQYPDYVVVKASDYEADSKESYKFLYEYTFEELTKCKEDLHNMISDKDNIERDYVELNAAYQKDKKILDSLSVNNESLIAFINQYISSDISVSDVAAVNSTGEKIETMSFHISDPEELSDNPGIYEYKRPSWFTPLQKEMNKQNIVYKNVSNTKNNFVSRLISLKKLNMRDFVRKAAFEYDQERKQNIAKILMSSCSNEEKYFKYILFTPGLSKDFQNILFSASELGLDANVVIELLEQPKESFNKEVIESFVSEVRKGTEYNLKQELAEDLVKGGWYVSVTENGIKKKLQLVPMDEINDIKEKLENISKIFNKSSNVSNVEKNSTNLSDENFDINNNENIDEDSLIQIFLPLMRIL